MSSLSDRIELLENDLMADPPRISVYHDLPFAIFRYDPEEEWTLRREARLLATRLGETGKNTQIIHISDLLWKAVEETEGIEAVVGLEKDRGFLAAQEQLTTYLSDRDWRPLAGLLTERRRWPPVSITCQSSWIRCRGRRRSYRSFSTLAQSREQQDCVSWPSRIVTH